MKKGNKLWRGNCFVITFFVILFCTLSAEAFYLPDTGQTTCYSAKGKEKVITCPPPGDPLAQDGSYTINPPSYTDNGDGTVFDNNTWLMWQQEDDGISRSPVDAEDYCENLTLAGYDDWRLPKVKELASIVDYGGNIPRIDTSVFMNTKPTIYWTSSKIICTNTAWFVYFGDSLYFSDGDTEKEYYGGNVGYYHGEVVPFYVRCVRGGPLASEEFVDNGNGTVTDLSTELTWQKDKGSQMRWGDALEYCEDLSLGGHSDWRLPNVKELESIVDNTMVDPSINYYFFPDIQGCYNIYYCSKPLEFFYWSSTSSMTYPNNRLTVTFDRGFTSSHNKGNNNIFVRCVRGQKTLLLDNQEIQVDPTDLDFWYVKTDNLKTMSLTLSNIGKDNLSIETITSPSTPFSVTYDGCSGQTLSYLTSCSITINFSPTIDGAFSEIVTISSNDTDHPNVTVNLNGQANSLGAAFLLPDTGQSSCYNSNGYIISCPSPEQPLAQDGSYTMNPPSFNVNGDETVFDNNTLLMWQQEDDGILRNWYDAINYCENLSLGGYSDWRLPARKELFSIVDLSQYETFIDLSVFPNTKLYFYWSSTTNASLPDEAWHVDFGYSSELIRSDIKSDDIYSSYARCVRGDELPFNVLTDNGGDSTVTDLSTGLMWQQYNKHYYKNWKSAIAYCEDLTLGGYSDWRLPNVKELESIVDIKLIKPFNVKFFSKANCYDMRPYFWSSTYSYFYDSLNEVLLGSQAYVVNYLDGSVSDWWKSEMQYKVLCVRGGNTRFLDEWEINVVPSSLDFGSIDAGSTLSMSFTISNTGIGNLIIDPITSPSNPFSITSDGCSGQMLSASSSCSVTVEFSPTVEGLFTDTLIITSNDADNPTVNVDLNGTATPPPGSLTGTVTDSATGLPLSNVTVTVTDSIPSTHSASTDGNGTYTITGLAAGSFTATFEKTGYIKQTFNGTLVEGETQTLDRQLTPAPTLTISITSPSEGAVLNSSPVTVTGTVTNNADVTVNGVQATVSNDTFDASVSLNEGLNTITAIATDQYNQTASDSITVTLLTKGSITGTVTDLTTGLPLSSATVTVTDSLNITLSALTDVNGFYNISAVTQGAFSGSISKEFYIPYPFTGTMLPGQTITIDAALDPAPPVISNIQVTDITTDSATVSWTTDQETSTVFEYGIDTSYGNIATDPTLAYNHIILITNLTPSTTFHFNITATNINGLSSSSGDQTFTTADPPPAITLTITSPLDGETIEKPDIMVRGTVTNTTGNETGVVVNGIVATVYGNEFIANHIDLEEGQNTITVSATDTDGNTVSTSINVNAVTDGNYVRITANIESGIAPLESVLRIDIPYGYTDSTITASGPAQPEFLDVTPDEVKVRMTVEGIYTFTASAKDSQSVTYSDTIAIVVLNKTELDALLKGKWEGMVAALMGGDIELSVKYFAEDYKDRYRQIFTGLTPEKISSLFSNILEIKLGKIYDLNAQCSAIRQEIGGTFSYPVTFVMDENGIWGIMGF